MTAKQSPETVLSIPELRGPRVSPTGHRVAFWSDETGRPEVWVADASTGGVWQVTERQLGSFVGTRDYSWIGDSHLLVRRRRRGSDQLRILTVPEGDSTRSLSSEVSENVTLRHDITTDGRYLISGFGGHQEDNSLYRFDLATDDRETLGEYSVAHLTLDPTDEWLAFTGGPAGVVDEGLFACWCRLDGNEFTVVTADLDAGVYQTAIDWHPDGDTFVFQESGEDRIGLHAPTEESTEWIVTLDDDDRLVGFLDRDRLLVRRGDGCLDALSFPRCQESVPVLDVGDTPAVTPKSWTTAGNGAAVVVTTATPEQAPRLLWVRSDEPPRTLHATSYESIEPRDLTPDEHQYESFDGTAADVEVYHADAGSAPTVGVVYSPSNGIPYFPVARERGLDYFVRRGYTVAMATTPSERLTEGVKDDQVAFGEWLREREWVAGDRIAIFGHSAGGQDVANVLLTREETPWQAGLMYNAVSDLFANQRHEPNNPKFTRHLGDPEENRGDWIAQSPIEHVEAGFDAPVRIHHGIEETRVPIEEIRAFREALLAAGHVEGEDFEYHELPNQNHDSYVVAQNARNLLMYVDFLDRQL